MTIIERIAEITLCVSVCALVHYYFDVKAVLLVALPLLVVTTAYILINRYGSNRKDNRV